MTRAPSGAVRLLSSPGDARGFLGQANHDRRSPRASARAGRAWSLVRPLFRQRSWKPTSMDTPHGDRIQVHPVEASDIDTPAREVRHAASNLVRSSGPRASERKDAALGTEVVLRRPGMPLVEREPFERGEESKMRLFDSVDQCASLQAHRAVARSHVIQIEIHLRSGRRHSGMNRGRCAASLLLAVCRDRTTPVGLTD